MRKKVGKVSVDSGQLIIVDPCYLEEALGAAWYKSVCLRGAEQGREVTIPGSRGRAVVVNSFHGDGRYPIEVGGLTATILFESDWVVDLEKRTATNRRAGTTVEFSTGVENAEGAEGRLRDGDANRLAAWLDAAPNELAREVARFMLQADEAYAAYVRFARYMDGYDDDEEA